MTLFPMSFTVEPWPIAPQWIAFVPMAIITGSSSSWTAASPPVMKRRVPFSAPFFEPVTGASSASAPARAAPPARGASCRGSPSSTRGSGSPGRAAPRRPSSAKTSRSTAGGSATQATTTSEPSASSSGVRAAFAPSFTSGSQRSGVRFQTVVGKPFFRRLRAMRLPMRPSPANPIRFVMSSPVPPRDLRAPGPEGSGCQFLVAYSEASRSSEIIRRSGRQAAPG